MGCIAIIGANSLALGPIAPTIALAFNTSVVGVMVASVIYGLTTAVSAFFLANRIDQVGPRKALLSSLAFLCLGLSICIVASGVWTLSIGQGLAGFATGIALPSIYSLATAVAPAGRESTVLGRVLVGWTLSLVAGVSLSALVADLFHWRMVYVGLVGLGILMLWAVSAIPTDPVITKPDHRPLSPLRALMIPGLRIELQFCFCFIAAFYGAYGYLGDHVVSVIGLSVRYTGLVAISYGIGFGLAALGDPLIDRFGPRRTMPLAFLCVGVVYSLIAVYSDSFRILLLLAFFWGVANHFAVGLIIARIAAISSENRGTLLGLNSAVTYIAVSCGTLGFGLIYQNYGFSMVAALSAALLFIATFQAFWRLIQMRRRTAYHPEG